MVDGEFYDAGAYKAAPVPMALEPGTVYEAERTGVSLGLFTITEPLESNGKDWIAEGTWLTAEALAAKKAKMAKKASSSKPRGLDEDEGPPKLRRAKPEEDSSSASSSKQTSSPSAPASSAPASTSPAQPAAQTAAVASAAPPAATTSPSTAPEDSNRPVLHRGKPSAAELKKEADTSDSTTTTSSKAAPKNPQLAAASPNAAQILPAISDADGPDPHSYAYILAGNDEQQFRKQILAIAAAQVRARDQQLAAEMAELTKPPAHAKTAAKKAPPQPQPIFEDAQMRVFDLSSSNEPEVVLMARAHMPSAAKTNGQEREYLVTVVARDDIYGQLHKALANITDADHLYVIPNLELIDAVDADGDGRGELLFRRISDSGSDYVIYRAIGDQLWPLFQGESGE